MSPHAGTGNFTAARAGLSRGKETDRLTEDPKVIFMGNHRCVGLEKPVHPLRAQVSGIIRSRENS